MTTTSGWLLGGAVALAAAALAALAGMVVVTAAAAEEAPTAALQVRVWQSVADERDIRVSTQLAGGSWATSRLALDDGTSGRGRYRFGDLAIDVSPADRDEPVTLDLRVYQHVADGGRLYVRVRPEDGGEWSRVGPLRVALERTSRSGRFRYGGLRLEVPLPPPVPAVTVEFTDDFTAEQRIRYEREIRKEFQSVARFFANRHGLAATGLTVRLTTDHSPAYSFGLRIIYLRQQRLESDESPANVQASPGGTVTLSAPEWSFLGPLAHEYVHALQGVVEEEARARAGERDSSPGMSGWMLEGMAWYLAAQHEQRRDMTAYAYDPLERHDPDDETQAMARDFRWWHWTNSRDGLWWQARHWTQHQLRSMESGGLWHNGVGYLAIEQLVERSSEAGLFDFFANLATATTWQDAFAAAFGLTVDDFYEAFEAWRIEAVPPPSMYSGVVLGPDGEPVQRGAVRVQAVREDNGDWDVGPWGGGVTWGDTTGDDGAFSFFAHPGQAVLVIVLGTGWTATCEDVLLTDIAFLAEDGGLTRDPDEARRFVVAVEGVSGIEIRLPREPAALCIHSDPEWSATWAIGWPPEETAWITWDYAAAFLPWTP